jgi:hypothetical protein
MRRSGTRLLAPRRRERFLARPLRPPCTAALATAIHPAPRTFAPAATATVATITAAGARSTSISAVTPVASLPALRTIASLSALATARDRRPVSKRGDDRAAPAEAIHLAGPELVNLEGIL